MIAAPEPTAAVPPDAPADDPHAGCDHDPAAACGTADGGLFADSPVAALARVSPPHHHRRPLERPVLTITGTVGLLLGSVAWAVTGTFAAAPLVFAASLTTAVTLAFAVDKAVAHAAAQIERADLRKTAACGLCGPLIRRIAGVLAASDERADAAAAGRVEAETRLALARKRVRQVEALLARVADPVLLTDGVGATLFRNDARRRTPWRRRVGRRRPVRRSRAGEPGPPHPGAAGVRPPPDRRLYRPRRGRRPARQLAGDRRVRRRRRRPAAGRRRHAAGHHRPHRPEAAARGVRLRRRPRTQNADGRHRGLRGDAPGRRHRHPRGPPRGLRRDRRPVRPAHPAGREHARPRPDRERRGRREAEGPRTQRRADRLRRGRRPARRGEGRVADVRTERVVPRRERRPGSVRPGGDEPALQRREVHARRRVGAAPQPARRRPGGGRGEGQRHGHPGRGPAAHLRPVLPRPSERRRREGDGARPGAGAFGRH